MPGRATALVQRAHALFTQEFQGRASHGAEAPGRVNLIGDHTDYAGGLALPMAIDRRCVVLGALRPRNGAALRIASANQPEAAHLPDLTSVHPRGWWSYAQGVAAMFARNHLVPGDLGLDLAVASDVPPGSGLSSSAAFEVATATCLEALLDVRLEPRDKARWCQQAEHDFAGVPCGIMDQAASILGRAGHALRMDFAANLTTPVALPADLGVVVVNTGVRRSLGEGAYARLHASAQRARALLGEARMRSERPIGVQECPREEPLVRDVGEHVRAESLRVDRCIEALARADWPALVACIRDSHASIRDRLGASCPEIECIVGAIDARPERGWAARPTGAGFGGCVVVLGRGVNEGEVSRRVTPAFQGAFGRAPEAWEVRAADGAAALQAHI